MADWIEKHPVMLGLLSGILINGGGWLWKLLKQHTRIEAVVSDHSSLKKEFEDMKAYVKTIEVDHAKHAGDTARHIDPVRDAASSKALTKRLDRIEEKQDEIVRLLTDRSYRRRQRGDSEDET